MDENEYLPPPTRDELLDAGVRVRPGTDPISRGHDPLERYLQVPNHAMFLYTTEDVELDRYIKRHWAALDGLTADACDIHISLFQLTGDADVYSQFDEVRSLPGLDSIRPTDLPAIHIWSNCASITISLCHYNDEDQLRHIFRKLFTIIHDANGPISANEVEQLRQAIEGYSIGEGLNGKGQEVSNSVAGRDIIQITNVYTQAGNSPESNKNNSNLPNASHYPGESLKRRSRGSTRQGIEDATSGGKIVQGSDADNDSLVDFAIVTAVEVERKAVCRAFELKDSDRVRRGSRVYWRGRLPLPNGGHYEIVVGQTSDMANVDAALLTSDLIHHWSPAAILLLGIAGAASDGSGSDDEALGDLIIASDVYYYERGKLTAGGKKDEPYMYKADTTLWNNVSALPDWTSRIQARRPDGKRGRPAIRRGGIASGEKVIAEAAVRDEIARGHRKIRAIEMEGYGFSTAVWQSFGQVRHIVMKAICDRADRDKKEDWQPYAAAVAAGYARHFLIDRPLEPRNPPLQISGAATVSEVSSEPPKTCSEIKIQPQAAIAPLTGLHRALEMARRALVILEEQAAGYGKLHIPSHLQIELEEKRREVAGLEKRLRADKS